MAQTLHFAIDRIDIPPLEDEGLHASSPITPSADGFRVRSFDTLLRELATRCRNICRIPSEASGATFQQLTEATPLQARALQLLGL